MLAVLIVCGCVALGCVGVCRDVLCCVVGCVCAWLVVCVRLFVRVFVGVRVCVVVVVVVCVVCVCLRVCVCVCACLSVWLVGRSAGWLVWCGFVLAGWVCVWLDC